jgi:hypothetical protein
MMEHLQIECVDKGCGGGGQVRCSERIEIIEDGTGRC